MSEQGKSPRQMSDEKLRDEEAWDWENATHVDAQPTRKSRAVVSVAFPGRSFDVVASAARGQGMRLSQFVREAAIEKAAITKGIIAFDVKATTTGANWSTILNQPNAVSRVARVA